jgi:hypothetical protein
VAVVAQDSTMTLSDWRWQCCRYSSISILLGQ